MAKIAIIGGGGFAKEVIEVAKMQGHNIVGIFALENSLREYPYLGYLEEAVTKQDEYDYLHIAIGAVNAKGMQNRRKILEFIKENNLPLISLISPKADIGEGVKIGDGVYIGHRVIVSCDSVISDGVLINQGAVIGHDCKIAENVSIAPLVFLGGNVAVEKDVMIGVRATIRQGVRIGHNSLIGMGSIVIKNILPNSTTLQMPSKIYRQ